MKKTTYNSAIEKGVKRRKMPANSKFAAGGGETAVRESLAETGDILCSVRAPVGRLNYTRDKIILGRGLCGIASQTGNQSFLYYQLNGFFFKEDIIGSGAIYAAVTKKDMQNIVLLTPPAALIQEFEETTVPIDKQIQNLSEQIQKLAEARDLLLPRLMNGEIEV